MENLIASIVPTIDIVDVVKQYVPLKKRGHNYVAHCPFHKDKITSFIVDSNNQNFKCFTCGAVGDTIKFIMNIEGMDYQEALQHVLLKSPPL